MFVCVHKYAYIAGLVNRISIHNIGHILYIPSDSRYNIYNWDIGDGLHCRVGRPTHSMVDILVTSYRN